MTPRGRRERPAAVIGLGLALGLALAPARARADRRPRRRAGGARSPRVPTIYHKSRSFRIPFNVEPADRPRLKEVQLWVSEDSGYSWKPVSVTTPDRPAFTFRAARDAEYWFAVRTVDTKGQLFPGEDEKVEPSMKVVVDTAPPRLVVEPDGRRGSLAAVRWEVRDEHLDLKSLVLEYQVEGGRDWRQVPIRPMLARRGELGRRHGRAVEGPRLGRRQGEQPDRGDDHPARGDAVEPGRRRRTTRATSPARRRSPRSRPGRPSPRRTTPPARPVGPGLAGGPVPVPDRAAAEPPRDRAGLGRSRPARRSPASPTRSAASVAEAPAVTNAPSPSHARPPVAGNVPTLLVPKPQFPLKYAVEDAGPERPGDRRALGHAGRRPDLVPQGDRPRLHVALPRRPRRRGDVRPPARGPLAASGLGDQRPGPGDPPETARRGRQHRADRPAPADRRSAPAPNLGKVAVRWRASDPHLAAKPVVISWRPEQPGSPWQPITPEPIANTGTFTWTVPPERPPPVPPPGRRDRHGEQPRLGRDHRRPPRLRRPDPPPEPDHRPRPQRPHRHRPLDPRGPVASRSEGE